MIPRGIALDIIESSTADDIGIVVPDTVRIDGLEVLVPREHPPVIHEIDFQDSDCAMVTITMFARKITVGTEIPADAGTPIFDQLAEVYT